MSRSSPESIRQIVEILRDPLTCNQPTRQIARFLDVPRSTVFNLRRSIRGEGEIYQKGIIEELRLDQLTLDDGLRSRVSEVMNQAATRAYAAGLEGGETPPPVSVVSDGETYWVWDGFRRVVAHKRLGRRTLLAEIRQGDHRDALLLSAGANGERGRDRTRGDKVRSVSKLLSDEEWSMWSDAEIARSCRVSDRLVSGLRKRLTAVVA